MSKGSGGDHFDRLAARHIAGMELPMSQTSHNHPLDRRDPADAPRCPMERLADRFNDAPKPRWLDRGAFRTASGECYVAMSACLTDPDQLDDLINFLSRVKG